MKFLVFLFSVALISIAVLKIVRPEKIMPERFDFKAYFRIQQPYTATNNFFQSQHKIFHMFNYLKNHFTSEGSICMKLEHQ